MTKNSTRLMLKVLQGPSSGASVALQSQSCTIGVDSACTLKLKGRHISDRHAVIGLQPDNNWIITNKSPNGTFLNKKRIDTQLVTVGDVIQVGAETIISVESANPPKKRKRSRTQKICKPPQAEESAFSLRDRPRMAIGGAIYVLLLAALGVYVSGSDSTQAETTVAASEVEKSLEQTRNVLLTKWQLLSIPGEHRGLQKIDSRAGESFLFYRIISSGTDGADRESAILELIEFSSERYFLAWQYQQQGDDARARAEYTRIVNAAPDLRLPSTWLAVRQLEQLAEVEE